MASKISAGTTSTTALVYTADTSGVLQLQTNGTTTAVTIDTSQNVGVGTTSPAAKVESFITSTSTPALRLRYNSSSYYADHLMDANGNYVIKSPSANGVTSGNINFEAGTSIQFLTNGNTATNQMLLDTNGNLGLGVTPSAWGSSVKGLDISSGGAIYAGSINTGLASNYYLNNSGNYIYKSSTYANGYIPNYANTGGHAWLNAPTGTAGNAISFTQAMTLDNTGNLLVNTTSQFNGGKVCVLFDGSVGNGLDLKTSYSSNGSQFIDFRNSGGTQIGYITQNGSTTINYVSSSDERLKTLIGVATDTSVIDNIVVNDFTWKTDNTTDRGVFAQDAYNVKPSAVSKGKDDTLDEKGLPLNPWGVDYSKFVPDLIVYCQQLKKQVTTLQSQVAALTPKA